MFYTLKVMKPSSGQAASAGIYLHQAYNIKHYETMENFCKENAMSRILNSLVKGLNEDHSMPRLIIMMVDHEFINMLHHKDFGISMMIGKCLHWLINEVDRAINKKKELLQQKKPGSITALEPKVIWMKMMEHPTSNKDMAIMQVKFNVILEQALRQSGKGFLIDASPDGKMQHRWFDYNGNMLHEGRIGFWQHISACIKKFNIEKTGLDPMDQQARYMPVRHGIQHASILPPHQMSDRDRRIFQQHQHQHQCFQ